MYRHYIKMVLVWGSSTNILILGHWPKKVIDLKSPPDASQLNELVHPFAYYMHDLSARIY